MADKPFNRIPLTDGNTGVVHPKWNDIDDKPKNIDYTVKTYERGDIGNKPNYDDPGVDGLFEIRDKSETPNATGSKPFEGYGPMLSIKDKGKISMLQIAGNNSGYYIRGTQKANVNMNGVPWTKINGKADSATRATGDSDGNKISDTYLKKTGGTLSGDISYANGSSNDCKMIQFKQGDNTGAGIAIGGGGATVIGGGESASAALAVTDGPSEKLILANDAGIDIYTNAQNGISSATHTTIDANGVYSGKANTAGTADHVAWSGVTSKPALTEAGEFSSATLEDLAKKLQAVTGGRTGSITLTKDTHITNGWYNFIWMPHRTGGTSNGDNGDYGTIILCAMTWDGNSYVVRTSKGGVIASVKTISFNGHTHNYAGSSSAGGDANRAVKIKDDSNGNDITMSYGKSGLDSTQWLAGWNNYELRAISPNNIKAGSATVADSANSLKMVTANGGNTNNYPFHRFAHVENVTGTYNDIDSIFLIRQAFDGGAYGVFKVSMRTNSANSAVNVSAKWLVRYGFSGTDTIQFGRWGVTGNSCYTDIFFKNPQTYPRTEIIRLSSNSASWTMCSSNEVNDTTTSDRKTSVECYSSLADAQTKLHGGTAYTATGTISDSGTVNSAATAKNADTAGNATKVNGHTVNSDVPANAKFTDTNTWRGIQNNLTSTATDQSLSAAQGKALNDKFGSYVPTSRKVNNKALTGDISLSASDVGAVPTSRKVNNKALTGDISLSASDVGALKTSDVKDWAKKDSLSDAINSSLGTGSSTPVDSDYYISQYVGGGTTTTTYWRRPMSALWEYVKGKISSVLGLSKTSYSGNAGSATKLQTARKINGVAFDGTKDITLPINFVEKTVSSASDLDNIKTSGIYMLTFLGGVSLGAGVSFGAYDVGILNVYAYSNGIYAQTLFKISETTGYGDQYCRRTGLDGYWTEWYKL